MLKKTITYEDFDGNSRTEDFYFGFTKLELMEMLEVDDLLKEIEAVQNSSNAREVYGMFKKLIMQAYGVKSDDGRHFIKSEELTRQFSGSPALEELIFEFLEDSKRAAEFVQACLPAAMVEEVKKAQAEGKVPEAKAVETTPPVPETWPRENVDTAVPVTEVVGPKAEKDPKDMTHEELLEAYRQKSQQQSS